MCMLCYRHIIIQSVIEWTLTQQFRWNVKRNTDQVLLPVGCLCITVIISDKSRTSHHDEEVKIIQLAFQHEVSNTLHMSLINARLAAVIDSPELLYFFPRFVRTDEWHMCNRNNYPTSTKCHS